jgi:hypothetical protein
MQKVGKKSYLKSVVAHGVFKFGSCGTISSNRNCDINRQMSSFIGQTEKLSVLLNVDIRV